MRRIGVTLWTATTVEGAELAKKEVATDSNPANISERLRDSRAELLAQLVAHANARSLAVVSVVELDYDEVLLFLRD